MFLLYNGRLDNCPPDCTALAIDHGEIIAVGSDAEILHLATAGTESFNLDGKYVMPGLTDSHIHLERYGESLSMVDCSTSTRRECLARVQKRSMETPSGHWILGHGWNQNLWSGVFGKASDLDAIAPLNPVFLTDTSLHSAWVNSKALELAHIDSSTPDPAGGIIQRDERGNPTGILFEKAVNLVDSIIPPAQLEERRRNLLKAQDRLIRYGVTAVHDFDRIPCFKALQELDQEQKLILRVFKGLPVEQLPEIMTTGLRTGFGSSHLRVGPIKLFADGALGPQTAAMLAPYSGDQTNYGKLLLTAEEIFETGKQAATSGLSLAVHAIGDRATQEVLLGYARLREYEKANELPALRHRVEHLQLLSHENLSLAADLQIYASMQPVHLYMDRPTADEHWGSRSRYAYAFASLASFDTPLIFGSDAPVESPNPFWGIHAAVTRCSQNSNTAWYPEERINLRQAINAYTAEPAKQSGLEGRAGELRSGQIADLIVLDRDPFQVQPKELYTLSPVMVVVEGRKIYQSV